MENLLHEKKKLSSFLRGISFGTLLSGIIIPIFGILFLVFISTGFLAVITVIVLIIAANLFFLFRFSKNFTANINKFSAFHQSLSLGNLPENISPSIAELFEISQHINATTKELKNVKEFFIKIGEGNLDNNIKVFNDQGELGQTLSLVREELKKVALLDRQYNWANEGLNILGECLRKNIDIAQLCDEILSGLIKYVGANQGNLFLINDENQSSPFLELKSTYAYGRKRFLNKRIEPGEGLAGQAWLEMDSIYLKEVPQNYTSIRSGLGEATPNNILIVPLKNDEKIQGVLEVASFKYLQEYEIKFIEKMAESISVTLSNSKVAEKTRKLLEETQQMTEQMRSQEEEMRQNMEELEATQEEIQRNTQEITNKEANLKSLINNIDAAVVSIDKNFKVLTVNNEMLKIYELRGVKFKIGDNTLEKLPENDREHRRKLYERAFKGEKFSIIEEIEIPQTKNKVFMEITHIPILDELQTVTGVTVFAKDITKDVLLRKDIEHKQALLEGLINNTDDNIMALDRNYNVTIINDRYKERYASMGYEYGVGVNAFKVMDVSIHEEWKGYYDKALSGEKFSFQKTFDDPLKTITREYSFNPIKDAEKKVVGLSIFNRLVSELIK